MIESLVAYSVAKRGWVLVLWALLAAGLLAIAVHLKLDALPDITSNQVQVLTRAPGLTPEEVEQRVRERYEPVFATLLSNGENGTFTETGTFVLPEYTGLR